MGATVLPMGAATLTVIARYETLQVEQHVFCMPSTSVRAQPFAPLNRTQRAISFVFTTLSRLGCSCLHAPPYVVLARLILHSLLASPSPPRQPRFGGRVEAP